MSDELKSRPPDSPQPGDETQTVSPDSDPRNLASRHQRESGAALPDRIGPYRILRVLGEGGMGVVYLAEQEQPIHRNVALKVIKRGMDSRQIISRFEAERQALALMNHANVARVFDAGTTDSGQPYFAMEHVEGTRITQYCDENRLTTKGRLRLFSDVCHAVQHAHQKGIIHRDIKPSNVLVAEIDGSPVCKVIDFGIAKATEQSFAANSALTEAGQLIGTPAYMSPEQAGGDAGDIDTRTDVYSLGALLYELLTGLPPFDPKSFQQAALVEVQRMILEVDPPKPSTRLGLLGAEGTTVATCRGAQPQQLARIVRGDLDWIVMRCLEKDRNRRYETANGLAMEIQRYLHDEPVLAGPPSAVYRIRKFARRNRLAVASVTVVAASLTIGLGAALYGRSVAEQARKSAEAAAESERQARHEEAERAEQLAAVARFQEDQLSDLDVPMMGVRLRAGLLDKARVARNEPPEQTATRMADLEQHLSGTDFTGLALNLLDEMIFAPTIKQIDDQFESQPLVRAQLLRAAANTARELGLYERASSPMRVSVEIRKNSLGEDHRDTLVSILDLGVLLCARGELAEAETLHRRVLERQRRTLGHDDPDTLRTLHLLGIVLYTRGRDEEAEAALREAMAECRRVFGAEHHETITTVGDLAQVLARQGKLSEAEPLYRESLALSRKVLGNDHEATLTAINNLGYLLDEQGALDEAAKYLREALLGSRRVFGNEHPSTLNSLANFGIVLQHQSKFSDAEPYLREVVDTQRRVLGSQHPETLSSVSALGVVLQEQGKLAEAEPYVREAMEGQRRLLGADHPNTLVSIENLGVLLNRQKKYAEAGPLFADNATTARRLYTDDNRRWLGFFLLHWAEAQASTQAFAAAEPNLLEAYEILADRFGAGHPVTSQCIDQLVKLYDSWHANDPGKGYDAKATAWRARAAPIDSANLDGP